MCIRDSVSPDHQKQLKLLLKTWDSLAAPGQDEMSAKQVGLIVKSYYTPSKVEVDRVMGWLDTTHEGHISFDQYCKAMAGVMVSAGLTSHDVQESIDALADDLAKAVSYTHLTLPTIYSV
eukprot:TRINITY_DN20126_c0_g1_i1.p1 TRINITY_DN20126_c0_g1~~TRINITY_DN20126_c0_g1_i1.p1  ORF type:complete len:120 (+),score=39.75 TRINITY_DN20126_c0_g1_i1:98-457(+)